MERHHRILVVDDEANVRRLLHDLLIKENYRVDTAKNGQEAIEAVNTTCFDLVMMDIRMPEMDGIEAFQVIRKNHPDLVVIMMTAFVDADTAVEAMRMGAFNYISKPFNISEVKLTLSRALKIGKITGEIKGVRQDVQDTHSINKIIGNSQKMQEVYKIIGKVAESNSTVLIQGETGTGKELIANAIHNNSRRKNGRLVKVNCAALPEGLLESELFGHEKGAFTGALEKKQGKFEYADGGTFFLDEIDETPLSVQLKLLRVIQNKEFERVGGLETLQTDVRIIAATNKDLEQAIKAGDLREDLYYRLNVVPIYVPPLRERKEDIPLLVDYFLNKFNVESKKEIVYISEEEMALLCAYNWSGNVRELENVIERAVVMSGGGVLMPEHFPKRILSNHGNETSLSGSDGKSLRDILRSVEKITIKNALEKNHWNRALTSRELKMSRKALWYKIEAYGLIES